MRISDWSSDVCSSDLTGNRGNGRKRIGGIAGNAVQQHGAVRKARAIDPRRVDLVTMFDVGDHGAHEADIVDLFLHQFGAPAAGVPCAADAVGIPDDEVVLTGHEIGQASRRARGLQYWLIRMEAVQYKKKPTSQ